MAIGFEICICLCSFYLKHGGQVNYQSGVYLQVLSLLSGVVLHNALLGYVVPSHSIQAVGYNISLM